MTKPYPYVYVAHLVTCSLYANFHPDWSINELLEPNLYINELLAAPKKMLVGVAMIEPYPLHQPHVLNKLTHYLGNYEPNLSLIDLLISF